MTDLNKLSISAALDGLEKGDFTSEELTKAHLNAIEAQQEFYENEKNNNELPLDVEKRRFMKIQREEKILTMENNFRSYLSLVPFQDYEEFVSSDPEEISDLREEIVLREAAEILVDSLQLNETPSRLSFGILSQ